MGFLRRGNKKKEDIVHVSPIMTSSFSSPEPLHLKLNSETVTVPSKGINNNTKTTSVDPNNDYVARTSITSSFANSMDAPSPTSLIDDIFLELGSPEENNAPVMSNGFISTEPAASATAIPIPRNADNTFLTTTTVFENTRKEQGRNRIPPAATATYTTPPETKADTILVGRNHSVNSSPNQKGCNESTASTSCVTDTSSGVMNQTKPALFKRKTASILDSDASDSEEEEEEDDGGDEDIASASSTTISSETGHPSTSTKQQQHKQLNGNMDKTTLTTIAEPVSGNITVNNSNGCANGNFTGYPSQATLMARMKERHRLECRKSWQPMDKLQQYNQSPQTPRPQQPQLYLQRVTPTMPNMFTMDNVVSPTGKIVPSESLMSFASNSRISVSPTSHQQKQQMTYRPRLAQPLSMPYALDMASQGSLKTPTLGSQSPTATSESSSKRESIESNSNRSIQTPSWSSSESQQQRRRKHKKSPSNRPASIQVTSPISHIPITPTSSLFQHQQHQQYSTPLIPFHLMPMTPPPDVNVMPMDSPKSKGGKPSHVPIDLASDIKTLPRKITAELDRMEEKRLQYSLPDLSKLATNGVDIINVNLPQQQQNRYSQPSPAQELAIKSSYSLSNLKGGVTSDALNDGKLFITEKAKCSPDGASNINTELEYNQLLPLGETLPTVLIARGTGGEESQYYLVLPSNRSSLHIPPNRSNQHHYCCRNHQHHQHHHNNCSLLQHSTCFQQQHHQHCHHYSPCNINEDNNTCRAIPNSCSKHQSKCNRSGINGKCSHQQQRRQCKHQNCNGHRHQQQHNATINKEKQQCCPHHNKQHRNHHAVAHNHKTGCTGSSLYSIASQLKAPPPTVPSS